MLGKASGEAKALGIHAAIESPDLADDLVSKADAQLRALAVAIDDEEALPEELRDIEVPEETDETETDDADEQSGDQDADADADADDAEDDDDDDSDGGEGLGAMFG
jgi:large subunit ribosomal protein L10